MNNKSIQTVVATGIGAALFVVIGMINIPLPVANTSIQLQYAVQALFAVIFGPVAGFFTGFIGHAVKDAVQYGSPWWSWVLASGLFGLFVGLVSNKIRIAQGQFDGKTIAFFNATQALANVLVWGLAAPILDIVVYAEPVNKVFIQGLVAGISNILTVAVAGTLLLSVYAKSRTQSGSLSKD